MDRFVFSKKGKERRGKGEKGKGTGQLNLRGKES